MRKLEVLLMLFCVAVMLGAIYLACYNNTGVKYANGTVIEGVNISRMTLEESMAALEEHLAQYALTVHGNDTTDVISAKDIGLHYLNLRDVLSDQLAGQQDHLWFLRPDRQTKQTQSQTQTLTVSYDPLLLSDAIANLSCVKVQNPCKPTDAHIECIDGSYQIVPEKAGNILHSEAVADDIIDALGNMDAEFSLADDYEQPDYTADSQELTAQLAKIQKMLSADITVANGNTSVHIGEAEIRQFLVLGKDFSVKLDKNKIVSFVEETYGTSFDSAGGTWELTNAEGKKIQVSGGNYHVELDSAGEAKQLARDIKSGKTLTRPPVCMGGQSDENGGIGNSFIEINLAKQTVWLVKDGEIVLKTPVVTGNTARGRGTPTGVYAVAYKTRNYTMRKYNAFVHYWMPYDTSVGIGLHDATWRSAFGEDIYQSNGSHGCINMPIEAAKTLYESIEPGIPVIVY